MYNDTIKITKRVVHFLVLGFLVIIESNCSGRESSGSSNILLNRKTNQSRSSSGVESLSWFLSFTSSTLRKVQCTLDLQNSQIVTGTLRSAEANCGILILILFFACTSISGEGLYVKFLCSGFNLEGNISSNCRSKNNARLEHFINLNNKIAKVNSSQGLSNKEKQIKIMKIREEMATLDPYLMKIKKSDPAVFVNKYFNRHGLDYDYLTLPLISRETRKRYVNKTISELEVIKKIPKVAEYLVSPRQNYNKQLISDLQGIDRREYLFKGGNSLYKDQPKMVEYMLSQKERDRFLNNRKELQGGASPSTVYHNELEVQTLVGQVWRYVNVNKSNLTRDQQIKVNSLASSIRQKVRAMDSDQLDIFLRSKLVAATPNSLINFGANHGGHVHPPMMHSRIIKFGDYHAMSPIERERNPLAPEPKGRRIADWRYLEEDPHFFYKKNGVRIVEFFVRKNNSDMIHINRFGVIRYVPGSYQYLKEQNFVVETQDLGTGSRVSFYKNPEIWQDRNSDFVKSLLINSMEQRYSMTHGGSRFNDNQLRNLYINGDYHVWNRNSVFESNRFKNKFSVFSPAYWASGRFIESYHKQFNA